MSKFKIGDKVVRVTHAIDDLKVGAEYEISKVSIGGADIEIKGKEGLQYHARKFELVTEEAETATHEGNVYEIGKPYLFSDGGNYWHLLKLKRVVVGGPLPFEVWLTASKSTVFSLIKEVPASGYLGTITPAPIELIDGNAYMFDWSDRSMKDSIGVYSLDSQRFYFVSGHVLASYCANIRPMTVAESK